MGYNHIDTPISNPVRLIDSDWKATMDWLIDQAKKRHSKYFSDGLIAPDPADAQMTAPNPSAIDISAIPNGFFHNGHYAEKQLDAGASWEIPVTGADGTWYVYLQAVIDDQLVSVPEDEWNNTHVRRGYKASIFLSQTQDALNGVYLGSVVKSGTAIGTISNAGKVKSLLDTNFLTSIVARFNQNHFQENAGLIELKNQSEKNIDIGKILKIGNQTLKVTGIFDDGIDRYNVLGIGDVSTIFPESAISFTTDGLGGRLGNVSSAKFTSHKALVFAVDDGTTKGYGIYPAPKSQISAANVNGGNTDLSIGSGDGYYMNPLALYWITEVETGQVEIVSGISRVTSTLAVEGSLTNTYDFVTNTVQIEQMTNFRLYDPGSGSELYINKYRFLGSHFSVDAVDNFISMDNTENHFFPTEVTETGVASDGATIPLPGCGGGVGKWWDGTDVLEKEYKILASINTTGVFVVGTIQTICSVDNVTRLVTATTESENNVVYSATTSYIIICKKGGI